MKLADGKKFLDTLKNIYTIRILQLSIWGGMLGAGNTFGEWRCWRSLLGFVLPSQLFAVREPALLERASSLCSPQTPPAVSPPMNLRTRRKTMAGLKICNSSGGISLQHVRRPSARPEAVPTAKMAERLVCRSLGITRDGEDVTEATLAAFSLKFKAQLTPEIIVAMRDFFRLDDKAVNDVEDALIDHGGEGALEIASTQDDAVLQGSVGLDAV